MPSSNNRTVVGFNVATLIVAILYIIGIVLMEAFWVLYITDSGSYMGEGIFALGLSGIDKHMFEFLLTRTKIFALVLSGILVFWYITCSAMVLVAAILGIRNYNNPAKLDSVFGWAIVGIVCSFLGCNPIALVLLILSAVYVNKLRNAPLIAGQPTTQPREQSQAYYAQHPQPPQSYTNTRPYAPAQQPLMQAMPQQPARPVQPMQPPLQAMPQRPVQPPVRPQQPQQQQPSQPQQPQHPQQPVQPMQPQQPVQPIPPVQQIPQQVPKQLSSQPQQPPTPPTQS